MSKYVTAMGCSVPELYLISPHNKTIRFLALAFVLQKINVYEEGEMAIQAITKTDVIRVEKRAKLKEVAQIMREKHVGSVIITEALDGKNIPIGIVTDRDLALTLGKEDNPQDVTVETLNPIEEYSLRAI